MILIFGYHRQINKSISLFLAQNRARNDASNRAEFLQSLAEKRRQLHPDAEDSDMTSISEASSCARTDAKVLDRDVQMKYDIAKNEEGPLRRTVKHGGTSQDIPNSEGTGRQTATITNTLSRELHPGLDERLANIESHLAVRYGKPRLQLLSECVRLITVRSAICSTVPARSIKISRRSPYKARKRLSTLGSAPFQSTSSRCKLQSTSFR